MCFLFCGALKCTLEYLLEIVGARGSRAAVSIYGNVVGADNVPTHLAVITASICLVHVHHHQPMLRGFNVLVWPEIDVDQICTASPLGVYSTTEN